MTDDVYFAELRSTLVLPGNNWFLGQDRNAQERSIAVRPTHHGQKAVTEMLIGAWYLDEFGNPTREIKARD